jgi:hypothetical protein
MQIADELAQQRCVAGLYRRADAIDKISAQRAVWPARRVRRLRHGDVFVIEHAGFLADGRCET